MPDYNQIFQGIVENWQLIFGVAGITGALFFDKIKAAFAKFPLAVKSILPKKKAAVEDFKTVEAKDIDAIAHLRDRAVAAGNETLLQEIKSISCKFFDMHSKRANINE